MQSHLIELSYAYCAHAPEAQARNYAFLLAYFAVSMDTTQLLICNAVSMPEA